MVEIWLKKHLERWRYLHRVLPKYSKFLSSKKRNFRDRIPLANKKRDED